jgi:glycosyltransferase involved in cell wall biosynthesis
MADTPKKIRVCYFGTYSRGEEYARNNAIISGLESNGIEVLQCQADVWATHEEKMKALERGMIAQAWAYLCTYLKLMFRYLRMPAHDFMFVGYIGHIDVFPAFLLAMLRRKPIVFDAFFSLYNTVVEDRGLYKKNSVRAKILHLIDRWSCKLADLVLIDTWEHAKYFCQEFRLKESKFLAVPLGTDEKNFFPRPWPEEDGMLDCISYSSYIPLHGIDTQLDAAEILRDQADIRFTFVGKGQLYDEMREKAKKASLENVTFIEWVTHAELVEMIAKADVVLGIFGKTDKASRVIPYKAYEALSMRKPLVTGDSVASRDMLVDGVHAILSPMGDAESLAKAILELKDDPQKRNQIAQQGRDIFEQKCTSEMIADSIINDMAKRWPKKVSPIERKV